MKNLSTLFVIICSSLLAACYSYGGWTPTVDPVNDPNAYRINQDMAECRELASRASNGVGKEIVTGSGLGAIIGAATGAIAGAIGGNPATGAAIGAATGAFGGGVRQGLGSEDQYKRAYSNCMRGRGHNTLN